MIIQRIKIEGVRNLRQVELVPCGGINSIGGANGSGKSSLLEAIHLLSSGKSFRPGEVRDLITRGGSAMSIYCELRSDSGTPFKLGIRRELRGLREERIDGRPAKGIAELAKMLPVVAMVAGSELVVEGGPSERRRLVDWALFHVEHQFAQSWREGRRVLLQRNAALKQNAREAELREWDRLWVEASNRMEASRELYVENLQNALSMLSASGLPAGLGLVNVRYRRGWPEAGAGDPLEWLKSARQRERRVGSSLYGAHRGDLFIELGGTAARHYLSRGQQKSLVYALRLAQVQLLDEQASIRPVLLLDDLSSELDGESLAWVLAAYGKLGLQTFITGTESSRYPLDRWAEHKVFHVEQGDIAEVV